MQKLIALSNYNDSFTNGKDYCIHFCAKNICLKCVKIPSAYTQIYDKNLPCNENLLK